MLLISFSNAISFKSKTRKSYRPLPIKGEQIK